MDESHTLQHVFTRIKKRTSFVPEIALVLGSGLGALVDAVNIAASVDYCDISDMPVSTVDGHQGRFVFGTLGGVPILVLQGRIHYYEGYTMQEVVRPVRLAGMLGAKTLILTNAAGGMDASFHPGDLMMIVGQIACLVPSPLVGPNLDALGVRFPDMSKIYDTGLQKALRDSASQIGIRLREGVYLQTAGPNYETPEEIKMYRSWGANAVGMSTATEAIAAHHMGLRVCGISCISNLAAGMQPMPLSHEEVKRASDAAAPKLMALLSDSILKIHNGENHD